MLPLLTTQQSRALSPLHPEDSSKILLNLCFLSLNEPCSLESFALAPNHPGGLLTGSLQVSVFFGFSFGGFWWGGFLFGGCGVFFGTRVVRAGYSTADAVSQAPKEGKTPFPPLPGYTPTNTAPHAVGRLRCKGARPTPARR